MCHYSLHRVFVEQKWSLEKLVGYVKEQGVDAIDFHVRFLADPADADSRVLEALAGSGLELSGLSLSTNFNQEDPAEYRTQIDTAIEWLKVAGKVKAPASRVFGGHIADRSDAALLKAGTEKVLSALRELVPVAEECGVILALENHGGLPCSGEEQVEVITAIDSPFLRATVDVGNYMQYPQEPVDGVKAAAEYCTYVHVKDNRREADGSTKATILGEGDVDIPACLKIIEAAGFDGFVAIEYEGAEDELVGVPKSVAYMKSVLAGL